MPAWVNIAISDLQAASSNDLIEAVRTRSLDLGQADPAPALIQTIEDEIRGSIGFSGFVLSATPHAIPASLVSLAVKKIVRELKGRLMLPLDKSEQDDEAVYQRRLGQLNQKQWPVELPNDPVSSPIVQLGQNAELISGSRRFANRCDLNGL